MPVLLVNTRKQAKVTMTRRGPGRGLAVQHIRGNLNLLPLFKSKPQIRGKKTRLFCERGLNQPVELQNWVSALIPKAKASYGYKFALAFEITTLNRKLNSTDSKTWSNIASRAKKNRHEPDQKYVRGLLLGADFLLRDFRCKLINLKKTNIVQFT